MVSGRDRSKGRLFKGRIIIEGHFFERFSLREFDSMLTPILRQSINFEQDNDPMSSYEVKLESVIINQISVINYD